MNLSKIRKYLYDNEIDIRQRTFMMNTINLVLILGITTLEIIFIKSMLLESLSTIAIILIFLITAFYSLKKKKINTGSIIITSIMCFIYFPITFINGGGISGVGPIWFIFNLFLVSMMLDGKIRLLFFVAEEVIGLGCYLITYLHPELTPTYTSLLSYIYSFTALILVTISIANMITFENRLFQAANEESIKQKEEIEALSESQNRFFSSMSHEIRTPINTIIGLNEMILREDISDEIAEDAANIRVAGKLLLNLINDILDMSKFQAGDMKILIDQYSVGNMLSDIVGMLWIRAREKNLELKVSVAPDVPTELFGDEVRIKQILMNVVNNAIKYTKEGSVSLSIECEKKEGGMYNMIYTVADTGMGIKKEDIPYLFTAYKRVDENSNKHIEGTGLGLSIVKNFLDLMGGKVTVNSVYTKGTTFVIEIPEKAATDEVIGEYDYEKRHQNSIRPEYKQKFEAPEAKILVVDDNKANLMVVEKLLRDTKVQVDTAISGREALKLTQEKQYHLIFMDHLMPEMDGIECQNAIKNQVGGRNRDTRIVILTANAGEENRQLYAEEGFDGYLVKPVSGEQLENEVYRFLPKDIVRVTGDDEILEETISWMRTGQKKKRVIIAAESVADIPRDLIEKYSIAILPHKVKTDAGTFKDGEEIDTGGVLSYMKNEENIMHPSPPSVEEMETFFAEQLTKANNVLFIAISSKIENTSYPYALEAAKAFDNVTIYDTKNLSTGQGMIAVDAARMAEVGKSIDEIVKSLDEIIGKIHTSFIVENLDYLARANQVTTRSANLIKVFMVRPVLVLKNGIMKVGAVHFGSRRNSWIRYINRCLSVSDIDDRVICITYVGLSKKELNWIEIEIKKKVSFKKFIFIQACPAIAVNCGPGTFGLILRTNK